MRDHVAYSKYVTDSFVYLPGPEYGTMEAAWKSILVESDRRAELHNRVREDLHLKVNNQLKQWQKDNYHKVIRMAYFSDV